MTGLLHYNLAREYSKIESPSDRANLLKESLICFDKGLYICIYVHTYVYILRHMRLCMHAYGLM
jgi:hypothetical protein